jgi:hypothetical protein
MNKTITAQFNIERETKNTVRYQERTKADDSPPMIGTLYIQKTALAEMGETPPESITVTIKAG